MADVGARRRRGQRGQLILVTGLLIAVAMVALVLLLNTAIYTENLASRGADQSGREAVEYRATVIEGVGELIDSENDREHGSWSEIQGNVGDGVVSIDNYTARSHAIGGTVVGINRSTVDVHEGRLLRQTSDRPFESDAGAPDWSLANDVDGTRSFTMTVDRSSLNRTNETMADGSGAFNVLVDGGTSWRAYVYRNQSATNEVTIATDAGGTVTEHCTVDASEVTIDVSAGTVAGDECPGFEWAEGVSAPYSVEFRNGDNATGTYNLTVNATPTSTYPGLVDGPPTSPYHVPAVYSTTFEIYYESPTLTYRNEVRVAPGEAG